MNHGYSGTPLPQKLGLKAGQTVLFIGLPEELKALLRCADFREMHVEPSLPSRVPEGLDVVHVFVTEAERLRDALGRLRSRLLPSGMIWVSWPKKSARVPTDVTEDVIRACAIERGLVDVKVCAVDGVWSGLKLVIPKALR